MMRIGGITDKNTWEDFIADYSPDSFFQSWNWGEVFKKCQISSLKSQNNLWRWGVYDNQKLVGVAQINLVKARRGCYLHIRHGPVLSIWEKEYFLTLLNNLKELARRVKACFIRISPLIPNIEENRQFLTSFAFRSAPIHSMDAEIAWVVDLEKDLSSIFSQMRKTTRNLIRKAEKLGVMIVKSKDLKDISLFLNLYDLTAKRHQFIKHKGIDEEFGEFVKEDKALLFNGYYQSELIATALIIFYNHQAIYRHSASITQKIPVNYLLQWEVIKEAKNRSKKIYNLWGIASTDKPNHPWAGLTLFKKGFGGRQIEYLHTQDLPLSMLYYRTYIIELVRKFRKGY